ncbi:MAG: response regulator [Oligoflexales bacterium]
MHFLIEFKEHEKFKNLKVSLLFNEDEAVFIPTAYALGAMMCLEKPLTKAIMQQSFKEAIQSVNQYSGYFLPYALKALRDFFKKQQTYEQLIRLEQSVIEIFNQDAHLLIAYAEAQFLTGNTDEALISLNQAGMIDPEIKPRCRDLSAKYVVDSDDGENLPSIKSAVIIDSDVVVCNFIESILTKLKAEKIEVFHDGETAFEWIKNNEEPTIIIMEWKLPKVTGPFLIQRINHLNFQKTNILISSSLIKKEDNILLREIGATYSIQKPLSEKKLTAAIVMILQQERNPFASQQLEQKIRKLLAAGSLHEAKVISKTFLHDKKISDSEKYAMNAEIAYFKGEYENCKKLIMKGIGAGGQNISMINLLGKCLMQLQDFSGAAKCFKKAQQISPLNIERLCDLASINSEMGQHEESEEYLQKVEKLDKNGDIVNETKVKVAFNSGKINEAQKLFGELSNVDNVIAYLNNQAVDFSRNDDFQNSIKIYIKALKSIPKDNKEYQSIVNYNLALTFAKTGDLEKALRASGAAAKTKESRVYPKAVSLKDRIIDARVKGKKLELKLSSIEIKNGDDLDVEYDFEAKGYEFEPGELCLYGIFQAPAEVPRKLEMLLNKPMPKL